MQERTTSTRRRLLSATGGLLTVGLAGCIGTPESAPGDGTTQSTTDGGSDSHGSEDHHQTTDQDHHQTTDQDHHQTTDQDHHEEEKHHTGEGHDDGGHGAEGPSDHVVVEMQSLDSGHHFHPHVAWVTPGGTVTFRNASGSHTATAYHPDNETARRVPEGADSFDSGLLTEAGATFEHTFETEGVYDVYCAPHEQLGMIGSVVVGRPDPHEQPGLTPPQEEMSDGVAAKINELNEQVDAMLGHEH